jgi:Ca2+-transporting ATPase
MRRAATAANGAPPWHAASVEAALQRLGTDAGGLTAAEAARRLAAGGPNALPDAEQRGRWEILLDQLTNLPTGLLLGSSALSTLVGDRFDAGAILAAVGLNAGIGYEIERTNEDLLASWRRLEAGEAQVVRGGRLGAVPAAALPGRPPTWCWRARICTPSSPPSARAASCRTTCAGRCATWRRPISARWC